MGLCLQRAAGHRAAAAGARGARLRALGHGGGEHLPRRAAVRLRLAAPHESGRTRAETFSSQAAVARARLVGAEIEFDETARSPCYHYFDKMRREHVVWFEDARSLRAKIALAAEKGLQGIGFWQAGRELAQAWPLLDALLTLETL